MGSCDDQLAVLSRLNPARVRAGGAGAGACRSGSWRWLFAGRRGYARRGKERREMTRFDDRPWWDSTDDKAALKTSRDSFFNGAAAGTTALIVEDDTKSVFGLIALLVATTHLPRA
jgi:hypothetical protein